MMQKTIDVRPSEKNKRLKEIDHSISNDATEATDDVSSVCSADTWSFHESLELAAARRRVRFATTSNGDVLCQLKQVERLTCPELIWWQPEEDDAIRADCKSVVEAHRDDEIGIGEATDNFLARGWKCDPRQSRQAISQYMASASETRGLERHISSRARNMALEHVIHVLTFQSKIQNECYISMASRQTSRPFVELALLKAQHDAQEVGQGNSTQQQ